MKNEKIYRRFIWVSVVASMIVVLVMISSMTHPAVVKDNAATNCGNVEKIEKITDLVLTKMM